MPNFYNLPKEFYAHWIRRLMHLSMAFIPWLYYWHGDRISNWFFMQKETLLILILFLILLVEGLRLKKQWVIFGQREYEKKRFSSFAFGAIAVSFALLLSPEYNYNNGAFGVPLILGLALVDPCLGELRLYQYTLKWRLFIGVSLIVAIWSLSSYYLGTPWIYTFIMPPVVLVAEEYKFVWVDDNLTMIIFPLILIWLIEISFKF